MTKICKSLKAQRCAEANEIIMAMSKYGRRFFYDKKNDRVAYFKIDDRGAIRFVDDYTNRPIYVAYQGRWHGFSHGGTLKSIVQAIAEYIRNGTQVARGHFGPWSKVFCDGDLWGYGFEEMSKLRAEIHDSPVLRQPREIAA